MQDEVMTKRLARAEEFRKHMNDAAVDFMAGIAKAGEAVHAADLAAGLSGSSADILVTLTLPGHNRAVLTSHFLANVSRIVGQSLNAPATPGVDHITPPSGPAN